MAFSFGAASTQQQPQQQQPSSLFGGTPAASTSTSTGTGTGFGFGQQQQQTQAQPATTSLFGSTTAKPSLFVTAPTAASSPAGGSLFGQQQQQQPQQPAASGGLFGSTSSAPSGGLFGQQQQQQQPQQQSTGLFGAAKPATPSGGLFGSTSQQPSTGLFGSQPQQQQQSTGLFGSAQPQQQQSSLFGSTQQQQPQQSSLFGSTQQQQQPQQTGLFGSTAAKPSLFASTAPGQQTLGASNLGASNLGASNLGNSALGASTLAPKQEESIEQRIMGIKNAWDVNSPECRFKYFFYNVVDEGTTQFYGRPAGATDDAKWARAVRDNPDPHTMVPVLATGWGDLQKRVQAMNQTASVHQQRVKELHDALAHLNRQTALSSSVRLAALQAHLQQLTQRLIHLAALAPTFAPVQSSAFRPEEGEMKHTLEAVKDTVDGRVRAHTSSRGVGLAVAPRSQNKGRMLGQINELWGAVEEVRRHRRGRAEAGWAGDDRMLAELATVLEQQQVALTKLSQLASDAVFDADVIRGGLAAVDGRK